MKRIKTFNQLFEKKELNYKLGDVIFYKIYYDDYEENFSGIDSRIGIIRENGLRRIERENLNTGFLEESDELQVYAYSLTRNVFIHDSLEIGSDLRKIDISKIENLEIIISPSKLKRLISIFKETDKELYLKIKDKLDKQLKELRLKNNLNKFDI